MTDTRNAVSIDNNARGILVSAPARHWLAVYDEGHSHAANRALHHVCAPVFLAALLGVLWCLPMPEALGSNLASINWATLRSF